MSTDEQAPPTGGSVPNAYRNALFWHWAPAMPKGMPGSFVTLLYALSAAADPAGRVRFRDGKAIRIKDIAAACKADEKDVRRYLKAAVAAGVVGVQGTPRRGRPSLYVLILSPRPDWGAALDSLASSRRKPRRPPPWMDHEKNGGVSPELSEAKNGGHAPELSTLDPEKERGTRPRMSSGDTPPFGSGDTPPNNPGIAMGVTHGGLTPETQPDSARPSDGKTISDEKKIQNERASPPPGDFARCAVCHERMVRRPGRDRHTHCAEAPTDPQARPPTQEAS